ncbi:MAG: DALR anticodon-binding domain-containing protein [Pseudanabaenaceae cyanobacterium bins.39]|nr:DALR anticodon-binding domain-containing protein [Pseudanabaenaceae cyanobacterium bins.39]
MLTPAQYLQMAIASAIKQLFDLPYAPHNIEIKIAESRYNCHYTSAIAIAIAPLLRNLSASNLTTFSPPQIAILIADVCQQQSAQFIIYAPSQGKGWLNIELQPQYLASTLLEMDRWQIPNLVNHDGFWLRDQPECNANSPSHSGFSSQPNAQIQYAYARCCGLLRLAYNHVGSPLTFAKITSDQIGWSDRYEINLLLHNLAIVDYLHTANYTHSHHHKITQKLSISLSQSFLEFFDHCRIVGVTSAIAQTRTILARITQKHLLAIAPPTVDYAMAL